MVIARSFGRHLGAMLVAITYAAAISLSLGMGSIPSDCEASVAPVLAQIISTACFIIVYYLLAER